MASPRVYVSSTCYDLGEIRDGLVSFVESYAYETVLSDRGDIFYHPDLHTHESCLQEIDNCQLFILIIGGRFGGHYVADRKKSIVNAEYQAARHCGIPVFCFVKREVLEDHRLYENNKANKDIISKIMFPSIEQQEFAPDIFEFINEVRNSPVNNGLFPFDFGRDIQEILRKQWAGMTFDFLTKRRMRSELAAATTLIENLTLASGKSEELLEGIYRHLDKVKAEESIAQLDKELNAKKFFQRVFSFFRVQKFETCSIDELMSISPELEWYEFLEQTGDFYVERDVEARISERKKVIITLLSHKNTHLGVGIGGELTEANKRNNREFSDLFKSLRELSEVQRKKVLTDFV